MSDLRHPDPRMGDEEEESPTSPQQEIRPQPRQRKEVKLRIPPSTTTSSEESTFEKRDHKPPPTPPSLWQNPLVQKLLLDVQWIPANRTWSKLKPVIRSSVVGFISVVLMVIPRVERTIGNVSDRVMFSVSSPI